MSPRHQRWLLKLGEYDFEIEYIKGKENRLADFLKRLENETDENNFKDTELNLNLIQNAEKDNVSTIGNHSFCG